MHVGNRRDSDIQKQRGTQKPRNKPHHDCRVPQPNPGWWESPQRHVTGRIRRQKYREGVEKGQARDGGLVHLVTATLVSCVLEAPQLAAHPYNKKIGVNFV